MFIYLFRSLLQVEINDKTKEQEIASRKENSSLTLTDLIQNASKDSQLSDSNQWLCPKCKELTNAFTRTYVLRPAKVFSFPLHFLFIYIHYKYISIFFHSFLFIIIVSSTFQKTLCIFMTWYFFKKKSYLILFHNSFLINIIFTTSDPCNPYDAI